MKLSFFVFTVLIALHVTAQQNKIQDITDKLFCHVYAYEKADSSTKEFLKKNFPYLTQKPPKEGWIMPPIGSNSQKFIISMKFTKHPFFDFRIDEGRLDFNAVKTGTEVFEDGVTLILLCKTFKDGLATYNDIINLYKKVSDDKKIIEGNDQNIARFWGKTAYKSTAKAEIVFLKGDTKNYTIQVKSWFVD